MNHNYGPFLGVDVLYWIMIQAGIDSQITDKDKADDQGIGRVQSLRQSVRRVCAVQAACVGLVSLVLTHPKHEASRPQKTEQPQIQHSVWVLPLAGQLSRANHWI